MFGTLITPWLVWLAFVRSDANTQVGMFLSANAVSPERIALQFLFYVQRIPDQITGPIVEIGTVFRASPVAWWVATLWSVAATACVALGLWISVSKPRMRLPGLIALFTLAALLFWPYTEAGRFLIPLAPYLLFSATEGLSRMIALFARPRATQNLARIRRTSAAILLAVSLPYSLYALSAGRARTLETNQHDFDAACDWLRDSAPRSGIVLSRHPGEVFWHTGRQGLEVSTAERFGERDAGFDSINSTLSEYHVAYVLIDRQRYARAPESPLSRFVAAHPDDFRTVWKAPSGAFSIFEPISRD
jgi:hypothetical protein